MRFKETCQQIIDQKLSFWEVRYSDFTDDEYSALALESIQIKSWSFRYLDKEFIDKCPHLYKTLALKAISLYEHNLDAIPLDFSLQHPDDYCELVRLASSNLLFYLRVDDEFIKNHPQHYFSLVHYLISQKINSWTSVSAYFIEHHFEKFKELVLYAAENRRSIIDWNEYFKKHPDQYKSLIIETLKKGRSINDIAEDYIKDYSKDYLELLTVASQQENFPIYDISREFKRICPEEYQSFMDQQINKEPYSILFLDEVFIQNNLEWYKQQFIQLVKDKKIPFSMMKSRQIVMRCPEDYFHLAREFIQTEDVNLEEIDLSVMNPVQIETLQVEQNLVRQVKSTFFFAANNKGFWDLLLKLNAKASELKQRGFFEASAQASQLYLALRTSFRDYCVSKTDPNLFVEQCKKHIAENSDLLKLHRGGGSLVSNLIKILGNFMLSLQEHLGFPGFFSIKTKSIKLLDELKHEAEHKSPKASGSLS